MQAGKVFIITRQEGGGSMHVIPETYSMEGYVTDLTMAQAICRQKNIAEGHPVDTEDWRDAVDDDYVWDYEEVEQMTKPSKPCSNCNYYHYVGEICTKCGHWDKPFTP